MKRAFLLAGLCVSLAACSPRSRAVPQYDDPNGKKAALASLSPWADGSPDRSHDHLGTGEPGSDRKLFLSWLTRYEEHEFYDQHDRDYVPFAVPGTIGAAIEAERLFEVEEAARIRSAQQQQAREDARAELQDRERRRTEQARQEAEIAAKAERDKKLAAEQASCRAPSEAAEKLYYEQTNLVNGTAANAAAAKARACLQAIEDRGQQK